MAIRVLIIDDDESILDAVSLVLEEEGYKVSILMKADEAYEKVSSFKPDVILLDVLMSGKDGRDTCRKLKEKSDTKHIPIIMISAHPSAGVDALAYGADAFLAKPFDTQDLLALISKQTHAC